MPLPRHPPCAARCSLLLLALAGAAGLAAQQPPVDIGIEEEIVVTEVLLDVLVTDRRGDIVLGLGPEDFIVEEGGEEVELTSVSFYSNRRFLDPAARAEELGIEVDSVLQRRLFIFLLHTSRPMEVEIAGLVQSRLDAATQVGRWIDERLLPNDYVAVLSYDTTLKIQEDFTADRRALARAVDEAVTGRGESAVWPARFEARDPSLVGNLPAGRGLGRSTPRIFDALEVIADAAAPIAGRKNLVFITPGFGAVDRAGLPVEHRRDFEQAAEALNAANVAVYPLLLVRPDIGRIQHDATRVLADETGGRVFPLQLGYRSALDEIDEENNGYYLLSYRASRPQGESGFQEVTVRTRNPELEVRYRRGYRYGG